MANLLVYKASAGSGKTYTLVRDFLTQALGGTHWSPQQFKRILCITFTRKATAEMKERILKALSELASGKSAQESSLVKEVVANTGIPDEQLQKRAVSTLNEALQDYSQLSVSTIDSFIQRMMQSLLWELNLSGEITVTLDRDRILQLATRHLLTTLKPNEPLYNWIAQNARLRTQQQEGWQIEKNIQKHGELIFSEQFLKQDEIKRNEIFELAAHNNDALLHQLRDFTSAIESDLIEQAENLETLRKAHGIALEQFSYGANSFWNSAILKRKEVLFPELKTRITSAYDDIEKWMSKGGKKTGSGQKTLALMELHLYDPYRKLIDTQKEYSPLYHTALAAQRLLPEIGLLSDFRAAFSTVERENATYYIEDLALLLKKIARKDDTSFIYERMGLRYNSLFIDEFQDTSRSHWDLLKPLVINSVSQGNSSMLVGDVKQAIYRWRGGDWELLAREIPEEFSNTHGLKELTLPTNYRSERKIVEFNNQFFTTALDSLIAYCKGKLNDEKSNLPSDTSVQKIEEEVLTPFVNMLRHAYQGVQQELPHNTEDAGYVEFAKTIIDENSDPNALPYALQKVEYLIDDLGVAPGNIAILVRRRNTAAFYVDAALQHAGRRGEKAYGVVSQDALLVDSSPNVQTLLSALRIIAGLASDIDRGKVARHLLEREGIPSLDWTQPALWETDPLLQKAQKWLEGFTTHPLLEAFDAIIAGLQIPSSEGEAPYVSTLRDIIFSYQNEYSVSLHAFLTHYQEQDPNARTMDMPLSPSAINILTIHKAKGLEFDYVICPEIDWQFASSQDSTLLWKEIKLQTDSAPQLLPCKMSKSAYKTEHHRLALREDWLRAVDALNLLYVAFTRAKKHLYLEWQVKEKSKNNVFKNLGEMAMRDFPWENSTSSPNTNGESPRASTVSATRSLNTYGIPTPAATLSKPTAASEEQRPLTPASLHSPTPLLSYKPFPLRIALSSWEGTGLGQLLTRRKARTLGNTLHELLASFTSMEALQDGLEALTTSWHLESTQSEKLFRTISARLQSHPLAPCFAPETYALAERDLLIPANRGGKTYRPDRVVLLPDQTVVIDFKFAAPRPEHRRQAVSYLEIMADMEYPSPTAFLWYIAPDTAEDHLEKVLLS